MPRRKPTVHTERHVRLFRNPANPETLRADLQWFDE